MYLCYCGFNVNKMRTQLPRPLCPQVNCCRKKETAYTLHNITMAENEPGLFQHMFGFVTCVAESTVQFSTAADNDIE